MREPSLIPLTGPETKGLEGRRQHRSYPFDEPVHDPLPTCLVEEDVQPTVLSCGHSAVTKLLVKNACPDRNLIGPGRAFRLLPGLDRAHTSRHYGKLPWKGACCAYSGFAGDCRGARPLDVLGGQFIDEAARNAVLPRRVNASMRRMADDCPT